MNTMFETYSLQKSQLSFESVINVIISLHQSLHKLAREVTNDLLSIHGFAMTKIIGMYYFLDLLVVVVSSLVFGITQKSHVAIKRPKSNH